MKCPQVDACVRLVHDLPDLSLRRGAVGVVCSTWFAPALTYEVEFRCDDKSLVRALLEPAEIVVEDNPFVAVDHEPAAELEFAVF